MAKLLFRLRNVPDDEADEVRKLLEEHDIEVYETDAGNWGISLPAIWLENEQRFDEASALIAQYQIERSARVRAEHDSLREQGQLPTLRDSFKMQPWQFLFYFGLIAAVLYLSISSFFSF
jgi:hypothetical protein